MELHTPKEDLGTVAYNGIELRLRQRPHRIGHKYLYVAMAVDAAEHQYLVTWIVKSSYIPRDLEFPVPQYAYDYDACDWADYIVDKAPTK